MRGWRLGVVGLVLLLGGCVRGPVPPQEAAAEELSAECAEVEALVGEDGWGGQYNREWATEDNRIRETVEERRGYFDPSDEERRQLFDDALAYIERVAIVAEQHPECFTLAERADIEGAYRSWLRGAEERRQG